MVIRKKLLQRRNALTNAEIEKKTQKFTEAFLNNKDIIKCINETNESIAIYFPFGKELSPILLAQKLAELYNKKFCLPITDEKNKPLKFANWDLNEENLVSGKIYKTILEPVVNDKSEYVNPRIIIVPLVGFDNQNRRMGMGAGFYDRTIEHYKKINSGELVTIGVAYDIQEVDEIPVDEYDKVLDYVIKS